MAGQTATISLCMIVKNEQQFLRQCLESVVDLVDEIILVDTGSTDDTVKIGQEYGAEIIEINWPHDFSVARNESIRYATSDWILALDADEQLDSDDKDHLLEFIQDGTKDVGLFQIYNYIQKNNRALYQLSYGVRLFKNKKGYSYQGQIHEQLTYEGEVVANEQLHIIPVHLHHMGYLKEVKEKQNKSQRNRTLILASLKESPGDPRLLYSLGNEYYAQHEYAKAVCYYQKSLRKGERKLWYMANCTYRLIISYIQLKKYEKALVLAKESRDYYVEILDFHYLIGYSFFRLHRYTLAIDTIHQLLERVKEKPIHMLCGGCDTFLPNLLLGDIYSQMEDYVNALHSYKEAFNSNPESYDCFLKIAHILNLLVEDKQVVIRTIQQNIGTLDSVEKYRLLFQILLEERLYDGMKQYMEEEYTQEEYDQLAYLYGQYYFCINNYDMARICFERSLSSLCVKPDCDEKTIIMLILVELSADNKDTNRYEGYINQLERKEVKMAMELLIKIGLKTYRIPSIEATLSKQVLTICMFCYEQLLSAGEMKLLQRLLATLNYINCNEKYIQLAQLYDKYGLFDQEKEILYQSIQEYGVLDEIGTELLYRTTIRK